MIKGMARWRSRRAIFLALLPLLTLVLAGLGAWHVSRARCYQWGAPLVCHVDTGGKKIVALTFDDGPVPYAIDRLLPILASHNAHATFFLTGSEMEKHPGEAARLLAAGQEIGNHSFSHQRMILHSSAWYDREIGRTNALLRREGLARPHLFRPPYGKKLIGLPQALSRAGMLTIMWDVEDPSTTDPAIYARELLAQIRPGAIILIHPMHRSNETARMALPTILSTLHQRGYTIVPVGTLLAHGKAPK